MTPDTSIYIHIPFCTHRCAYCDFNTYAGQEDSIPAYVNALIREIEFVGLRAAKSQCTSGECRSSESKTAVEAPLQVHTIFFGGGTPSLLSSAQFEKIFCAIRENFDLLEDSENTIEAITQDWNQPH